MNNSPEADAERAALPDTSKLIDQMEPGGLDDIFQPDVVIISCGCSARRRRNCPQRRANKAGCDIPITEDELANLYNSLPVHIPENKQ